MKKQIPNSVLLIVVAVLMLIGHTMAYQDESKPVNPEYFKERWK